MKKEIFRLSKIEKKLKIENLTRCLNCALFCKCRLQKEEIIVCEKYREIDVERQVVIVPLKEWSHLSSNSLCKYMPQRQ